jgi:hypothetical protein
VSQRVQGLGISNERNQRNERTWSQSHPAAWYFHSSFIALLRIIKGRRIAQLINA